MDTWPWIPWLTILGVGAVAECCMHPWSSQQLFLVTLGREASAAERALVRRRRRDNLLLCSLAAVLSWLLRDPLWGTIILWLPALSLLRLVADASRVRGSVQRAPGARFAVSLQEPPSISAYVSWPLQVVHVGLIALACATFALAEPHLGSVVLHWNAAGQADRVGDASMLWIMPLLMVFCWGFGWLGPCGVAMERWALPEVEPERYATLQLLRRRLIVRTVDVSLLVANLALGCLWLAAALSGQRFAPISPWAMGVGVVASVLGLPAVLIAYMPQLSKVQKELRALSGTDTLGTRDDGWRWGGLVYHAPHDPALFVPKAVGVGTTLNMGRPAAWVLLAFFVLVPAGLSLLVVLGAA